MLCKFIITVVSNIIIFCFQLKYLLYDLPLQTLQGLYRNQSLLFLTYISMNLLFSPYLKINKSNAVLFRDPYFVFTNKNVIARISVFN
jgi:hypothetical protein